MNPSWLTLPERFTPTRVTTYQALPPDTPVTLAQLDGPGCIRRIWAASVRRPTPAHQRQIVLRMFWDGADAPAVEAPLGDFFGQIHGLPPYPLDSRYLTRQVHAGYTATFPMPFQAGRANRGRGGRGHRRRRDSCCRPTGTPTRRSLSGSRCASTRSSGAKTPARPSDATTWCWMRSAAVVSWASTTAWPCATTGRAGRTPAPRTSTSRTPPTRRRDRSRTCAARAARTRLAPPTAACCTGPPRISTRACPTTPKKTSVPPSPGTRWRPTAFSRRTPSPLANRSRCASARWPTTSAARPIGIRNRPTGHLFACRTGTSSCLARSCRTTPRAPRNPEPRWQLLGPFHPDHEAALDAAADRADAAERFAEMGYPPDSPWRRGDRHVARWAPAADINGFVDFSLTFRPIGPENSLTYPAVGLAETWLHAEADDAVTLQVGWVNELRLRVGDGQWESLGRHAYFRNHEHRLALRAGWNRLQVKLDNPDDGLAAARVGILGLRAARDRWPRARARAVSGAERLAAVGAFRGRLRIPFVVSPSAGSGQAPSNHERPFDKLRANGLA